jgi:sugar/nucleoside kinase (ribokinase family)
MIETVQTSTNHLIYKDDGTKTITFEHKAPDIQVADIPKEYLDCCKCYYICPMDFEVDIEVITMLSEKGKTVIIDLGGYGGATSTIHPSVKDPMHKELLRKLCKYSEIVKASREDLSLMMDVQSVEEMADFFMELGAKNCVITKGGDGSYYRTEGASVQVPVCKAKNPFNFTGAGDSFGAGLTADYCKSYNVDSAVRYGNAVASLVVEKEGGCVQSRMPSNELTIQRMKGEI